MLLTIREYDEDPTTTNNNNNITTTTTTTTTTENPLKLYYRECTIAVQEIPPLLSSSNTTTTTNNNNNNDDKNNNNNSNNRLKQNKQILTSVLSLSLSVFQLNSSTTSINNTIHSFQQILYDLFLPVGYPNTVRNGYIQYQFYDSIQGLCSYLRGVLCTAAVLEAIGVGQTNNSNTNTALAAAITWAQKDGIALCGGLLFSYKASKYFDAHVKEFRLFADIINDIGFLLDMIAPIVAVSQSFSSYLLFYITSIAVLCKTMCGISASATKGSITAHFAIAGNMADLNAKESTQETAVNLLGMVLGIYTAKLLHSYQQQQQSNITSPNTNTSSSNTTTNWILFSLFTLLHVYANYMGVLSLRLRTINRSRADAILQPLVEHYVVQQQQQQDTTTTTTTTAIILSPEDVHESLLQSTMYIFTSYTFKRLLRGIITTSNYNSNNNISRFGLHINVKCSLHDIVSLISSQYLYDLYTLFHNEKYAIIVVPTTTTTTTTTTTSTIYCILFVGATPSDEMKAYTHASLVQHFIENCSINNNNNNTTTTTTVLQSIQDTYTIIQKLFCTNNDNKTLNLMYQLEQAGWDVDGSIVTNDDDSNNNNDDDVDDDGTNINTSASSNSKGQQQHRVYLGFSRHRSMWTITEHGPQINVKNKASTSNNNNNNTTTSSTNDDDDITNKKDQ